LTGDFGEIVLNTWLWWFYGNCVLWTMFL